MWLKLVLTSLLWQALNALGPGRLHGIIKVQPFQLDKCPWVPECFDEHVACDQLAWDGQCVGLPEDAPAEGPYELHPSIALDASLACRKSCMKYIELVQDRMTSGMKQILNGFGGHLDYVIDPFGYPQAICDVDHGMTTTGRRRMLENYFDAQGFHMSEDDEYIRRYTKEGIKMSKVPEDAWSLIMAFYSRAKKNNWWSTENCISNLGISSCQVIDDDGYECSVPRNASTQQLALMHEDLQQAIGEMLMEEAEKWAGVKLQLNNIYGVRRYLRGSWLAAHTDIMKTHIISVIINVGQKIDEPWPLHIKDHEDNHYKVYLEPRDMVWYESARLPHGRLLPFKGDYFDNMFVHFKPLEQEAQGAED